jgi:mannosyltransferase OCH1-like enzyme
MQIPKRIWQTWKTHEVPDEWKASPQSIRQYCPDWSYHLMDDYDNLQFVEQNYPEYLQLYKSFDREIYRADLVRYLLLYQYGGVYLDLDIKLKRPLEDLFAQGGDLYLVKTPNWSGYTNSFMASVPKCPFWLKCIQKISERAANTPWYIRGDIKVLWTTGPNMVSEVLKKYNHPYMTIPSKLGHPCTICDHYFERSCSSDESYIEELKGSSWSSQASWFHFFVCRWQYLLFAIFLILFILFFIGLVRAHQSKTVVFDNNAEGNTKQSQQTNLNPNGYKKIPNLPHSESF